jgi:hypothetical protein
MDTREESYWITRMLGVNRSRPDVCSDGILGSKWLSKSTTSTVPFERVK